jgi:uncharacterized membrane protein YgcG
MKRAVLAWLLLLPVAALSDERILEFHSDIVVRQDGWIDVTEHITVRSEQNRILRGIYRDFPTDYIDRLGNSHEVDFEPLSVLRNDSPEDFHSRDLRNGVRVYFGRSDRYIDTGVHTYTFRYRASRMLGFFEEHDELYWNVTGFDWAFPIDRASASVLLAFGPPSSEISFEAYTGRMGASERNYTASIDDNGRVSFTSTKPLSPLNGMTIVVGWPKGFVSEPSNFQRFIWLLKDNANFIVAIAGLIALLTYNIPVWSYFGKDPTEGVIVTRYEPPDGFSPASLRYIQQMYYDNKTMTAAVVNLAVKGYLRINATVTPSGFFSFGGKENEHSLTKVDPGSNALPLAVGEKELHDELFRHGETAVLDNEHHEKLGEAMSAHKDSLKRDYRKNYFQTNGLLNIPAILIVLATTVVSLNVGRGPTPLVILTIVVMFLTMAFFAIIMKRPTMRGRKLLDEMAGFRDYLEVAEKYEMNLRNPPEKTPQLFEAYLPFALALGVDHEWAEKFAGVLASAQNKNGGPYHPAWYHGAWSTSNLATSTSHLSSSLNTAISSSVTPPGSSSGGGGGGFSGGGGGGGGGGGW